MDLFDKNNRFNIANLITFGNIAAGLIAIHFIVHGDFFTAIILAWIAGALDIADGKVARKYNLSTEFGIQVDKRTDVTISAEVKALEKVWRDSLTIIVAP
ncbi:MAG TPA: CDP-alcohol phosphatidyltransferase family protein [Candidatus Latescibacteria bacterium]|nr:CDP-alcohol phosphatidyltransferase family protein [Candidatus Latescibacterota bacterium]